MQFGLYAPIPMVTVGSAETVQAVNEALLPLPAGRRDAQFDLGLDLLSAADAAGFELTLFAERHLGSDLSAWVMASAIASRLPHMRALVAVHPGLWDPVMVAKIAASLDRICIGRTAINIVNGWYEEEFRMFGGALLQGEERYQRTIEFIEILRGVWTNEKFSYDGKHYKVDAAQLLLKPASAAPPDIYSVSRSNDIGRDLIAAHCDWWFLEVPKTAETADEVVRGIAVTIADMERRTQRFGRKVRYAISPFVALGKSQPEALDETVRTILNFESDPDTRKIERRMLPATKAGCIGAPDDVKRQMRRFRDVGVELVLCKFIPTVEIARRIGEELIGPLRDHVPFAAAS